MSYGWPVKPFDEQHPVRGFFCDPRIGAKGSKAFHFGVDVSAPDGTAVYAVAGGTVHSEGAQNVGVVTAGGRSHGYWHILKRVRHGQRVRKGQLLGHIAKGWGHVHFAERIDRHYWNPLREGALTPFRDYGAPVIDRIVAERGGRAVPPGGVTGRPRQGGGAEIGGLSWATAIRLTTPVRAPGSTVLPPRSETMRSTTGAPKS